MARAIHYNIESDTSVITSLIQIGGDFPAPGINLNASEALLGRRV
jgi:hypothetical protein